MKGILLKDWYETIQYCRAFIFLMLIFSLVGGLMAGNAFFTYYPCILSGMIAMSLIAYEEKEKWDGYAATLPYTRAQLVSSKYIITLCAGVATILINLMTQAICMLWTHAFNGEKLLSMFFTFVPFAVLPAAFLLPFIYKFGANKGRIVYYIILGVVCAAIGAVAFQDTEAVPGGVFTLDLTVGVMIFVLSLAVLGVSWMLSIRFYRKREI